jgi:phosphoenolpyruvate carboxylase
MTSVEQIHAVYELALSVGAVGAFCASALACWHGWNMRVQQVVNTGKLDHISNTTAEIEVKVNGRLDRLEMLLAQRDATIARYDAH